MQMIETIPDITLYTDDSTTNWLLKVMVLITGTQHRFFSWLWKFYRRIMKPLLLARQLANVPKKKCLMNFKPEWACFACKAVVFSLSCQPVRIIRVHLTLSEPCCHQGLLGRKHEVPYDGKKPFCLRLVTSLFSWHFSSGVSLSVCDLPYKRHLSPSSPLWLSPLIFSYLSVSFGLAHWSHSSGWHQGLPKLSYLF